MPSEPSIPNLLSLRGRRGAPRAPLPRGGGARSDGSSMSGHTKDNTIRGTDHDAATSRLSAVGLGYLDDSFAQFFIESSSSQPTRRLPIINRGTYIRTRALDRLVTLFLGTNPAAQRQIISLGAGTDTRVFRLLSENVRHGLVYHEVDFPATVRKKAQVVQTTPALLEITGSLDLFEDGSWACHPPHGGELLCHAVDLRDIALKASSFPPLRGLLLDVPTLLISECCLCYLETPMASGVLRWFADRINTLAVALYEPIRPHDAFGEMMVSNLAQRGIRMPTLEAYPSPTHQENRLRDAMLDQTKALTIREIWDNWVPLEEKERVDLLEGLDEVEEWQLLADHYVVAWGWRGVSLDVPNHRADEAGPASY